MVEQFADKDKYEFMLLDGYGGVIASSSGTGADGIVVQDDFNKAQDAPERLMESGALRKLNDEYFKRIEAIEH